MAKFVFTLLMLFALTSVVEAGKPGWICDSSGCRPATKAAAPAKVYRKVEHKRPLLRLFGGMLRGCRCGCR